MEDEHLSELRDIEPETIADIQRACNTHLEVVCEQVPNLDDVVGCGRIGAIPIRQWGFKPEWHISDLRRRMVCMTCRRRYPRLSGARVDGAGPRWSTADTHSGHAKR